MGTAPEPERSTVWKIVAAHCGPVRALRHHHDGSSGALALIADTEQGRVFCKAVHEDTPRSWTADIEARVGPHLPPLAPWFLWSDSAAGWTVNAFEVVTGRPADLAPGSPDLPLLADTLARIAVDVSSWPIRVQPIAARWGLDGPHWEGASLIHTDPAPANFMIDGNTVRVVDWAWPAQGPAWVDTALVALRLIDAGHTPASAETWARTVPAFAAADPEAITEMVAKQIGLLAVRMRRSPAPYLPRQRRAAWTWLQHRRGQTPT